MPPEPLSSSSSYRPASNSPTTLTEACPLEPVLERTKRARSGGPAAGRPSTRRHPAGARVPARLSGLVGLLDLGVQVSLGRGRAGRGAACPAEDVGDPDRENRADER